MLKNSGDECAVLLGSIGGSLRGTLDLYFGLALVGAVGVGVAFCDCISCLTELEKYKKVMKK